MSIGVILVCLLALISILSLILLLQNRKVRRIREVLEEQEKALMSQMEILQEEQENLEKSKKEIRDMITEWMERGENSMECPGSHWAYGSAKTVLKTTVAVTLQTICTQSAVQAAQRK